MIKPNYKRVKKEGTATLAKMRFINGPSVILTFSDKSKLKLDKEFLADAVEYYISDLVSKFLKEK